MTNHKVKHQHGHKEQTNHDQNHQQNHGMGQENPQENFFQNPSYNLDPRQFIPLWEQMGASTGGLIGRFIGLNFYAGAAYLTNFLAANPMQAPNNYPNVSNQVPYPFMPVNQNPVQAVNQNSSHAVNQNPDMAVNQSTGLNNQPIGYYVTIQTDADNAEAVQKIIQENNGHL